MIGGIRIREGLYEACGLNASDYTPAVWRAKKPKIHKNVCKILSAYVDAGIIEGYEVLKDENDAIRGVDIIRK